MEPNYNCSVQHASIKQVKVCLATAKIEIIYFVRIIRNSKVFKIEKLMSGFFLKKLYETKLYKHLGVRYRLINYEAKL